VLMNEAQATRAFPEEYGKSPLAKAYSPEVISHLVSKFVKLGYRPESIIGGPGH
jgi:hypothetical protein